MLEFQLPDMSCGHCVKAVTQACQEVDPAAKVHVDLATKKVEVDSAAAPEQFAKALTEAGYPPAGR
ncbi:heavy-metal-associated domain-containing protein [Caenimonas sp. SL110]|uniref:heavy-metal-associated domain-containing protein n=1 Tax=Caenimonas sp. SL110 TaxID=1450524 RepID=UPI000653C02D|nr:heavy-metal-associated domain-containing protein [Caenimonas sp. SL110]